VSESDAIVPAADLPLLTSWGNTGVPGREMVGEDLQRLTEHSSLSRGLGRSYGDSALPAPGTATVACSRLADRILSFEPTTGVMRAEAGLSLLEINRIFLRQGFFPPVTPGTQFVTLGGMVASDVHGKNHHGAGTFGQHVRTLKMRVGAGVVECSPEHHPDLFWATIGGMGLTGHILEVEFAMDRIPTPWIWQESFRVNNIDEYIDGLKDSASEWPMTMGWIDCLSRGSSLGRGILMRGRWATKEEAPPRPPPFKKRLTMPAVFPSWTINDFTVAAFNRLYFWKQIPARKSGIQHPDSFFYPLDAIRQWNRMYGKAGFTQYQCVLPNEAGRGAARRFLELLTTKGGASFLCVIKDCGEQGDGLLSFPMAGISIAIDFAIRPVTAALVATLNEFVIAEGGRIYLTKDTFTTPEHFAAMEPRLEQFQSVRRKWDPLMQYRSAQSVRVFGG
jgi:decaprenylphospho-beta-D-ribofuranose 2-oxidase